MPRQRVHSKDNRTTSNSSKENAKHKKSPISNRSVRPRNPHLEAWNNKLAIFVAANVIIVILCVVYFFYQHYLENVIITPLDLPKAVVKSGLDVSHKYWGSYRPGTYFGLQTRSPQTLATGMMWFTQKMVNNRIDIRHWCDQWDNVKHYSWLEHDGENFGIQKIEDKEYFLVTSFVKQPGGNHGGDWTAKISVRHKEFNPTPVPVSLMFYAYATADASLKPFLANEGHLKLIRGNMNSLGNFSMYFREMDTSKSILKYNYLSTEASSIAHLRETVLRHHAIFQAKDRLQLQIFGLTGEVKSQSKKNDKNFNPNFIVYQCTFIPPFELEVFFESDSFVDRPAQFIGATYNAELDNYMKRFEERFEKTFPLQDKTFDSDDIKAAWAAVSNMIGGIGYFYGSSFVQSNYNKDPISYWNAPLYTAVPSRSFFPRGFLWDEGFHNLLILEWDPEITKDIMSHWLDLMNAEGWIAREQILGIEARERVPAEFIVQRNTNANPPTLFLTFERLLHKMKRGYIRKDMEFLKRVFPRLKVWFQWFNRTQAGMLPGTYRWRGRDSNTDAELNPKTLTSGLDDYPRATHPTLDERHVDLRSWIAFSAGVLADIGDYIGEPTAKYRNTQHYLSDNKLLDQLHWSDDFESYCDYGFHSRNVKLMQEKVIENGEAKTITYRVVNEEPALRYVHNFGYVSLFPFLLKIIDPNNTKLVKVLVDLRNPKMLWSDYGLRSLAKNSPYYMKYNTEHDPPYWRGSIWININFLAIRALHHYSVIPGPYKDEARTLYRMLRENVVRNILKEYKRTGYIWEQYDDITGEGKGVHPFTGWSALFVLLMAEIF